MEQHKTQVALNDSLTNYYQRVTALSGVSKLMCTVAYLANHKFFGTAPFIETIINGGELPEKFLNHVIKMIDSELKVDFSDDELVESGERERGCGFSYSELFYINALAVYLEVGTPIVQELLGTLKFNTFVKAIPELDIKKDVTEGLIVQSPKHIERMSLNEIIQRTYVDMHVALDQGAAELS